MYQGSCVGPGAAGDGPGSGGMGGVKNRIKLGVVFSRVLCPLPPPHPPARAGGNASNRFSREGVYTPTDRCLRTSYRYI